MKYLKVLQYLCDGFHCSWITLLPRLAGWKVGWLTMARCNRAINHTVEAGIQPEMEDHVKHFISSGKGLVLFLKLLFWTLSIAPSTPKLSGFDKMIQDPYDPCFREDRKGNFRQALWEHRKSFRILFTFGSPAMVCHSQWISSVMLDWSTSNRSRTLSNSELSSQIWYLS